MIDCGTSFFSKSGSAINVGTNISTRVTFHKKFNNKPIVMVSWAEYNCVGVFIGLLLNNKQIT